MAALSRRRGPALRVKFTRVAGTVADPTSSFQLPDRLWPPELPLGTTELPGVPFYFQLVTEMDDVKFIGTGPDPTGAMVEFPSGEPGSSNDGEYSPAEPKREYQFSLIVPDIPEARRIKIFSRALVAAFPTGHQPDEPVCDAKVPEPGP